MAFAQSQAQETPEEETANANPALERLAELVMRIDPASQINETGTAWQMKVAETTLIVVTDPNADRMRIMTPIASASDVTDELMARMMQANFDSALDARYALAQGIIWGVFIHNLSDLSDKEFLSGLGQTVNVAKTFGTVFTSGAMVYGGGDSGEINRQLIEELLERGKDPV